MIFSKRFFPFFLIVAVILPTWLFAQPADQSRQIFEQYLTGSPDIVAKEEQSKPLAHAQDVLSALSQIQRGPAEVFHQMRTGSKSPRTRSDFTEIPSSVFQDWQHKIGSDQLPAADRGEAVVRLNSGFVVVGSSDGGESSGDAVIAKYDSAGNMIWKQHWGQQDAVEKATQVAVDQQENIYVCVTRNQIGSGTMLIILKIDAAGIPLWHYTFAPAGFQAVEPVSMIMTKEQSPAIAGTAIERNTSSVFLLQITAAGQKQWERFFQQPSSRNTTVAAMTIGSENQLILTGYATNPSTNVAETLVLSYNDNGRLLWKYVHESKAFNFGAMAALDEEDNVYICGFGKHKGLVAALTLALNNDGQLLWDKRATMGETTVAQNIAVVDGRVRVAAYTVDINRKLLPLVISYTLAGTSRMTKSIEIPGIHRLINPRPIFDRHGDLFLTASAVTSKGPSAMVVASINRENRLTWWRSRTADLYASLSIAGISADEGVTVSFNRLGNSDWDIWSLSFSGSGELQAEAVNDGPRKSFDAAETIVADDFGNTVVAVNSYRGNGNWQIMLSKFSSDGKLLWRLDPGTVSTGEKELVRDIAVDSQNQIWLAGFVDATLTGRQAVIWKVGADGKLLIREQLSANGHQTPIKLLTENDKNILVAGTEVLPTGEANAFLISLDNEVVVNWRYVFDTAGPGNDFLRDAAVDQSGNTTMVGYTTAGANLTDLLVWQVNRFGELRWYHAIDGHGQGIDIGNALAVDNNGDIYVAATTTGLNNVPAAAVYRFSPDGRESLFRSETRTPNSSDLAFAVAVSQAGGVFLAGSSYEQGINREVFVNCYSSTGEPLWRSSEPVELNEVPQIKSLLLNSRGEASMLFSKTSANGNSVSNIIGIGERGNVVWRAMTGAGGQVELTAVTKDLNGKMVSVGNIGNSYWQKAQVSAFRFGEESNRGDNHLAGKLLNPDVGNPYPNPFNPETQFSVNLPQASAIRLSIYNVLGELVAEPANSVLAAGEHRIFWDARAFASGQYFYRLQAGGQQRTGRLLLVK